MTRKYLLRFAVTAVAALAMIGITVTSFLVSYPKVELKGRWIAFGCGGRLYVIREDGKERRLLLPGMYQNLDSPTWSPDGYRIAFGRKHNPEYAVNNGITIESVNLLDPGIQLITGNLQTESWGPNWSPDGQWILFESYPEPKPGWELFRVHPDGTNREQLTHTNDVGSPSEADWSPTGDQIVYRQYMDVMIMNADGSEPRTLITSKTQSASPTWSPDGDWIAFVEQPVWEQSVLSRI